MADNTNTETTAIKEEKSKTSLTGNAQKVMDMVEKMTVLELNDLVKALEEKFGVSASAPMMVGTIPTGTNSANGNSEPEEEQTEFDVVLVEAGSEKITVIKVVREIDPSLGLVDAKKLVESAPKTLLEGAKKEVAQEAKKKLEATGAKVELK
ncbi:50S ribosomal protein L7/L12 [Patescibacteria group bacterium]|nr:50S ribosomal protein L7/L12 [Patescibacteria group bacterium]